MATTRARGSAKRSYSIRTETAERFDILVPPGRRSQVIEEMMARHVAQMEAQTLAERIRAGLADMADVYAETDREWAHVDAEAWPAR